MTASAIKIPQVTRVPEWDELPGDVKVLVIAMTELLPYIGATDVEQWQRMMALGDEALFTGKLADCRGYFDDPLREPYRQYHDLSPSEYDPENVERSAREMALVGKVAEVLRRGMCDLDAFIGSLEAISSAVLNGSSTIRTRPVYLAPDPHGSYVEYLEASLIRDQLALVFLSIGRGDWPAVYRAVIAYVLLVGAHPFLDGNGRVSRLVFNAVLVHAGLPASAYVPVKEIYSMSLGTMSIQKRRAQLRGDWQSIVVGMCRAIDLTERANRPVVQVIAARQACG